MKFILLNILIIAGTGSLYSQISDSDRIDTVNIRKNFFQNEKNWDPYLNRKTYFENRKFALIALNEIPYHLSQETMNVHILSRLTSPQDIELFQSVYESSVFFDFETNETLNTRKKIRKFEYFLKDNVSYENKIKIFNLLQSIRFKDYDYYLVFYKTDSQFEPADSGLNLKNRLAETYTFGKFEFIFDSNHTLNDLKVYYQDNNNSYIHFNRKNPKAANLILFGKTAAREIPFYHPFETLKTATLNSILNLIQSVNKSEETLITKEDRKIKDDFIQRIIAPSLRYDYQEDGAVNDAGDLVYISNLKLQNEKTPGLNCSGFVKDVIDNYIRLKNPDFLWLRVEDISRRRDEDRKDTSYLRYEFKLDPYFGLDWAKNLVEQINIQCNYRNIRAYQYSGDPYAQYFDDKGYNLDSIKEVLFRDQQKDFNYFYILVFNRLRKEKPMIPEYYHLAIVVPYFENNHFYLRVFESTDETSFDNIRKYQAGSKAAVFKIPLPRFFQGD